MLVSVTMLIPAVAVAAVAAVATLHAAPSRGVHGPGSHQASSYSPFG